MLDKNNRDNKNKKLTDNKIKSPSLENNFVHDLSKVNSDENDEQFKESPSSENNFFQNLSKTNLSGNNEQINPEQEKIENDANCDITLSKVFELITELQKSLIAQTSQIKDIQDKQELIINKINELSNDVKNPLPNIQQKTVRTKSRSNKYEPPIIPVAYLQEHGEDELHKTLETMTVDELKQMNKLFLNKQKKELDKIDREQMIQYLIKYAETELNRGAKFLEDR